MVSNYVDLAIAELKKNYKFKFGGVHNMELKKKRATVARKGVNPFRKELCVFKSKPASKTLCCFPMKKFEGDGDSSGQLRNYLTLIQC